MDIKIAEQTLLPWRAKLKLYESLPFGKEIIKRLGEVIKFSEKDIIEKAYDDEAYELDEFYEMVLSELAQFYFTLFNYLCNKKFDVLSTDKEKIQHKKYKKSKEPKEIENAGKTLGKLISKRFARENPEIIKKNKNFLNYFERKIAEKVIAHFGNRALNYFEELIRVQETTDRLFPKRDYLPNKKYTKEDFDFMIELKEKQGIPFNKGVQRLEEIKQIKINYESFLRRLSDYYNKKSINKNQKQTSEN